MKKCAFIVFLVLLCATTIPGQTNVYQVPLVTGYNAIANQVNQGGNTLNEVLTNPPAGATLQKWNVGQAAFDPLQVFTNGGWIDTSTMLASTTTLNPGEGAFLFNPGGPTNLTFTGLANQPHNLDPPCGQFLLLSRATNGLGIYENITGLPPQDGTQFFIYDTVAQGNINPFAQSYKIFTFCGGGWLPSQPIANVGQAVFLRLPCFAQGNCLTVQQSNVLITASNAIKVSFSPAFSDGCSTNPLPVNIFCRPPSGSLFTLGSTPVHAVALDAQGVAASTDFTVTIAPAPLGLPTQSYGLNIHSNLTLFAYQFINGGNTLQEIMPNVPDGTIVSKYDNSAGRWFQSKFNAALGAWVPPNITLRPGEGAFLQDPTNAGGPLNFNLNFTGQPNVPVLPISLAPAIQLVSRQTNGVGNYTNIIGVNPGSGTKVYKWNGVSYDTYLFNGTVWSPFPPTNAIGEAWWFAPNGSVVPPAVPVPPAVTHQPVNLSVSNNAGVQFLITPTGTSPFQIQWRLNGNAIPGATNPAFNINGFQPTNGGGYDVLVQNTIGTVKDTIGALTPAVQPAPFSDLFSSAGSLPSSLSGFAIGSNVNASTEVGELSPGFIPGGASVWIKWTAPTTGIVTFTTAGSSFDTLLAAYTGGKVGSLTPLAFDDDSAGFLCSSIRFNVTVSNTYMIQVDGFYGATGNITLNWSLPVGVNGSLPVILGQPDHQTVAPGGSASFNVKVPAGSLYNYTWMKDGVVVAGLIGSTITVSNVTAASVGVYQAKLTDPASGQSVLSFPTELEINIPDAGQPANSGARAETKFAAASDPNVRPSDPYDPTIVAGYTGTQITSAYGLLSEPAEPIHCGVITVATLWQAITAPGNGLLTVANTGTPFKGVLAVYTAANLALMPLDCSSGHAAGQESCAFTATNGTTYQIAMSVTNLADITGPVHLVASLLSPPVFTTLPSAQSIASNTPLTLTSVATGSGTIGYQWMLNGTNIPGATNAMLPFGGFNPTNSGDYAVRATNNAGTNLFSFAPIYVNDPLAFINTTNLGGSIFTQLVVVPNSNYVFQSSTDLKNWSSNGSGSSATGVLTLTDSIDTNHLGYFYRAYLQVIP